MTTTQFRTLLKQQQSHSNNLTYLKRLEDVVEYALAKAKSAEDINQQKKLFSILRTITKEQIRCRMHMAQNNIAAEKVVIN